MQILKSLLGLEEEREKWNKEQRIGGKDKDEMTFGRLRIDSSKLQYVAIEKKFPFKKKATEGGTKQGEEEDKG